MLVEEQQQKSSSSSSSSAQAQFTVQEFGLFAQMVHNFVRFFRELFRVTVERRQNNKLFANVRQLLEPLFRLARSPLLSLHNVQGTLANALRAIIKSDQNNCQDLIIDGLLAEIETFESKLLGAPLEEVRDFSQLVPEQVSYEARTAKSLESLLERPNKELVKPLELLGQMNHLKMLIETL
jgi:hypothetical protein